MIVSERSKKIFQQANIRECEFIPVVEKKSEDIVGYLLHCMNIIVAFDEQESLYNKLTYNIAGKEYEQLIVMKYAVKEKNLDNVDLFKLKESNIPYFVSEILVEKIKEEGLKGVDFTEIMVTG